jgi:hypothetical protein
MLEAHQMSDDVLKIIPTEVGCRPSRTSADEAVILLRELRPDGDMCEARFYDRVTFIDQGENIEAVICPGCGRRLELHFLAADDPNVEWWRSVSAFDDDVDVDVAEYSIEMPCCNSQVSFAALRFEWPAGFACFELAIWNPNVGENLSREELGRLEQALGCALTQVRAHY